MVTVRVVKTYSLRCDGCGASLDGGMPTRADALCLGGYHNWFVEKKGRRTYCYTCTCISAKRRKGLKRMPTEEAACKKKR